ncbi:MAG: diphthine synthase, partial [Candidatus Bathyarchaeota archaeon]|nr:diphthine synthase [Candidatus Bathyarchaeota archaeon]
MGELLFVGLGLYDERDVSLRGLEEIREADAVFAELYTSLMPGLSIQKLEELVGKRVSVVSRRGL